MDQLFTIFGIVLSDFFLPDMSYDLMQCLEKAGQRYVKISKLPELAPELQENALILHVL